MRLRQLYVRVVLLWREFSQDAISLQAATQAFEKLFPATTGPGPLASSHLSHLSGYSLRALIMSCEGQITTGTSHSILHFKSVSGPPAPRYYKHGIHAAHITLIPPQTDPHLLSERKMLKIPSFSEPIIRINAAPDKKEHMFACDTIINTTQTTDMYIADALSLPTNHPHTQINTTDIYPRRPFLTLINIISRHGLHALANSLWSLTVTLESAPCVRAWTMFGEKNREEVLTFLGKYLREQICKSIYDHLKHTTNILESYSALNLPTELEKDLQARVAKRTMQRILAVPLAREVLDWAAGDLMDVSVVKVMLAIMEGTSGGYKYFHEDFERSVEWKVEEMCIEWLEEAEEEIRW
ncbi:hypothetical protein HDV00_010820 [Rhizophlyctis rosea]|nr:hypothetical protein HDV00_010820 [Rhizophlyctis rosea]